MWRKPRLPQSWRRYARGTYIANTLTGIFFCFSFFPIVCRSTDTASTRPHRLLTFCGVAVTRTNARTHSLLALADKAFTAMQFLAVLFASFAMVVFMVTLFRPASGGSCCNVKTVAMIGVGLMAGFAFFQMLAFVLVIVIEKDADSECVCVCFF